MISMIPSATMPANRTLSAWLQHRLDEVGKYHGGLVPLHGRLFQQWLHYAYPRECNFPHISGTIDPQLLGDTIEASNGIADDILVNKTEMQRIVAAAPARKNRIPGSEAGAIEESAMWSMEEELVVWRPSSEHQQSLVNGRGAACVGAILSLSVALIRSLGPISKDGH